MRVKHVTDRAIFWSLGRGEGDEVIGVEVSLEGEGRVSRKIVSRGKYGKERTVFLGRYSADEYLGILRSESALLSSSKGEDRDVMTLIVEAIELLRRASEKI
ncbi:MAG: hypothetical protein HA492_03155 [Candidatus Verstraetearchaeota archaeon]|nr:hypothetical protein [Candidatus Verstraetearchaeota archaeon]